MRRHFIFLTAPFILAGFIFISCTHAQSDKKTPKAVSIILNRIPADVIEKLNPPSIAEISKANGFTRIDMVYHTQSDAYDLKNVSLEGGLNDIAGIRVQDYESDHCTVVATYKLKK